MEKKVKKCENVENDQNEKRKEKIVFSPLTCDTFQCFQPLADEEPRQNSDPNELVELKPEDSTGRILRTGDPINSGPVPGCSARGTSVEDQGRPTGLLNSTVEQMNESVVSIIGKVKNHQVEAMIDSGSTGNFVSLQLVEQLETKIDKFESELEPLTNFILPGGDLAAAQLHYARTIVRRAETQTVELAETDEINANCIRYLNRLSDLFFVMSRLINKRKGRQDILWKV